jgi:hypothetical protein
MDQRLNRTELIVLYYMFVSNIDVLSEQSVLLKEVEISLVHNNARIENKKAGFQNDT